MQSLPPYLSLPSLEAALKGSNDALLGSSKEQPQERILDCRCHVGGAQKKPNDGWEFRHILSWFSRG